MNCSDSTSPASNKESCKARLLIECIPVENWNQIYIKGKAHPEKGSF
jgi:hypothetical protein